MEFRHHPFLPQSVFASGRTCTRHCESAGNLVIQGTFIVSVHTRNVPTEDDNKGVWTGRSPSSTVPGLTNSTYCSCRAIQLYHQIYLVAGQAIVGGENSLLWLNGKSG